MYSPVVPSGDVTISPSGAITVISVGGVAGPFAPLVNPPGGANNYAPIDAPVFTTSATSPTLTLTGTGTQLFWGSSTAPTAVIFTGSANNMNFGIGANNNGSVWTAVQTTAAFSSMYPGGIAWFMDTGLTVGATFNPTQVALLNTAGFNLTAGNYQVNGTNFGGTCAAGDFVTAISSSVIPTCATPAGGGGGGGTVTSITAGIGLTGGTITTSGTIALAANPAGGQLNFLPIDSPAFTSGMVGPQISVTNYVEAGNFMQSPTFQFTPGRQITYDTPDDLVQYIVDANVGAGTVVLSLGSNGALSILGMLTTPSITLNGTLLAIGGTCAAGDFVNSISAAGTPACATPAGGGGSGTVTSIIAGTGLTGGTITTTGTIALAANPAGGQLNFAPIASPAFTGTVTFPSGSTATTAGLNNLNALGIGQAAPAPPTLIGMTANVNGNASLSILNSNTGTAAQALYSWSNGTNQLYLGIDGTGYTAPAGQGNAQGPNSSVILSTAANGLYIGSFTAHGITKFFSADGSSNSTAEGYFNDSGWNLPALTLNGTLLAIGGTCSAGQFVNALSAAGVPACATPAGGGAPVTNPAGGANNYAPIASPTFTGTVTTPALTMAGSAVGVSTSWTPVFAGLGGTPPTVTYTTQMGRYTRINQILLWQVQVAWSAFTLGTAGFVYITGPPPVVTQTGFGAFGYYGISYPSGVTQVNCELDTSNRISWSGYGPGQAGYSTPSGYASSGEITCTGWSVLAN
jgi:hypothetical protein